LKPLSTVQPREFAETIMRMPDAHGATRPFSFNFAPYQLEPYLEIFNPRNVEVDMMMASRLGKSRIVLTALGFVIVEQPCRIGVMWPVEGDGKLWSKDDFMGELVEPTPEIAALIADATGQRKSKNTLLHKQFAGGLLQILGANAPGRMRRMKARVLYADEIDAIIEITTDEGDQLKIFAKRGAEFPDCIQVYCSYPSLKNRSRIEAKLLASDLRQWLVTCLLCGGEPIIMSRTGLDPFNDGCRVRASVRSRASPGRAPRVSPTAIATSMIAQRYAMMMGGDPKTPRFDLWRATRPFTGKAGFHANSLLWPHPVDPVKYPGGYLQVLAQKEIDVEKSENPERARRVLVNTDDAETFESVYDAKPDHSKLFLRREEYDPAVMLPAGVLAIFFFVDVQVDRLELFIQGAGARRCWWDLDYQVIKGSPLVDPDKGVWAELDRILLTTTYAHPSGKVLRIRGGLIDCGYQPDKVFAFTRSRSRRGIFASAGSTQLARPIIGRRAVKRGNPATRVWELGTHEAKDIIYQCLDLDNPVAAGYRHYPALGWCSEPYFKALTAEDSEMRKGSDGKYHKWFGCDHGVRNEPLDGAVGCMAASRIPSLKPNFAKLAIELAVATAIRLFCASFKSSTQIVSLRTELIHMLASV
jgi:phage terminase large subunit GpA-like protein